MKNNSGNENVSEIEKLELVNLFFLEWDQNYQDQAKQIALFNSNLTSQWNQEQRTYFVKLLYHQRAHFDDVLWYMGNFSPDAATKEMVLNNIRDEFGKNGRSHEKLYLDFAKNMGVDLTYELIEEKFYLPFLREYNHGHLRWLRDHNPFECLVAFAAIERLDNLDYTNLKTVVESFNLENVDLLFFKVHMYVKHFEEVEGAQFNVLWENNSEMVKRVFNFIGNYQLDIWKKISDVVFNY